MSAIVPARPEPASSKRRLALVFVACALGVVASFALLKREIKLESGSQGAGGLARLEASHGTVKRRASGSFAWTSVNGDQSFGRRDSIRTGSGGSATLLIERDGSRVELGENSLFVVDETADLRLSFVRGSALWRKPSGGDAQIETGADGRAVVREFGLRVVEPTSKLFVAGKQKLGVRFAWEGSGGANETRELEISTSARFLPARTTRIPVAADARTLETELPAGNYHWRIVEHAPGAAAASPLSASARFEIAEVSAATPIWPVESLQVGVLRSEPWLAFRFSPTRASSPANAQESWIEIARDGDFTRPVARQAVPDGTTEALVRIPETGRLQWRLVSTSHGVTATSSVESFVAEPRDELGLELVAPAAGRAISSRAPVVIRWKSTILPPQGVRYRVKLEPGSLELDAGESSQAVWKNPEEGKFRAQVVAHSTDGRELSHSDWLEIALFDGEPVRLSSPINGVSQLSWASDRRPPQLSWNGIASATYRVEWARDVAFHDERIERQVKGGSLAPGDATYPPLGEGTWYWRVSAVEGPPRTSEVRRFAWGAPPPLASPTGLLPAEGQVVDPLSSVPNRLGWAETEGAKSYELTLDGKSQAVNGRTFTLPDDLPLGVHRWSVRPVDALDRKGRASPVRSFVLEPPALQAPESTTREVQ